MAYTTIDDPSAYFQTAIYTGNGGTISIVNDGNSDLQPDLLWFKVRSHAGNHSLQDSVRGASLALQSDTNSADADVGTSQITAFNSDGFSLSSGGDVNTNSRTYVAWQWKETADAGFDIVSYTGNATGRTIAHNLNAVPKMIITKNRSASGDWYTYHQAVGNTKTMLLNQTNAASGADGSFWNNTSPTSSVFSVGSATAVNGNGNSIIAYVFAEKQGYSKFGSYTGNGNADGTFVYTGFKPAWVMAKRTDSANGWMMFDNKRSSLTVPGNPHNELFNANTNDAEGTTNYIDILSNGWKIRSTDGALNNSGGSYIYMCFAESPFVTGASAIPATAR